ncbi:sortase family protein [Prauserella shujinwangii]|uniref:Sortase family protein n=1 Tax=Prauserella shujinwangii TaxID=1453103 RepID=A0A2T0LSB3_9PSEU|nr:sortase [Prauserella shujinwangii]PRX46505.1 sortase family protein [Prauserella shujinwangii]
MTAPGQARRAELGRLAAASAAVVVALAAVLTTANLMRSGTGEAAGDAVRTGGQDPRTAGRVLAVARPPAAHEPLATATPIGLRIPAIDLRIPGPDGPGAVIELGHTPRGSVEVPGTAAAVGWLAGTAAPGERGAAVLTGHTDLSYERGVFFRLDELRPGDTVEVRRSDGTTAVFTVYRVETRPTAGALDHATAPAAESELRLLTAASEFDPSFGGGTDAVLVFARLTDVTWSP